MRTKWGMGFGESYSATACWADGFLASSAEDGPTQGSPPLTNFSSSPANTVVETPAANERAISRRFLSRSSVSSRSRLQPLQQPLTNLLPSLGAERRGCAPRKLDDLLTLCQPSSCSRLYPVSKFVLLPPMMRR